MERHSRGLRPWSLVAVLGVGLVWACSGDAMHMAGDAAVDLGEALQDASCAMAQDGGDCEPEEPAHGAVVVVCTDPQVATWSGPEGPATQYFELVTVPVRNVRIEHCWEEPIDPCAGSACTGTPPPVADCRVEGDDLGFVSGQLFVRCPEPGSPNPPTTRVIW